MILFPRKRFEAMISFWTLSIVLLLFKTHNVSETEFYLRLQVNLLSWAQSIALVLISGHQHQHKIGYIIQAQHKPSARVKINTKIIKKTPHT
jgi:hypothetical protein